MSKPPPTTQVQSSPDTPETPWSWKLESSQVTGEGSTICNLAAPDSVMQPFVGMPLDFRFRACDGRLPRDDAAGMAVDAQKVTARGKAWFGLLLYPTDRSVWLWFGLDMLPKSLSPSAHEELLNRFEPVQESNVWKAVWCPLQVPFEGIWRFRGPHDTVQKFRVSVGRRQMGEFWGVVGDPEYEAFGIGQLMLPRSAGASFRVMDDLVYHLFVRL